VLFRRGVVDATAPRCLTLGQLRQRKVLRKIALTQRRYFFFLRLISLSAPFIPKELETAMKRRY